MKKFYTLVAVMAGVVAGYARTPEPLAHTDYTGDSFKANWTNADNARLSVFSISKDQTGSEVQDFSSIIKNGAVDAEAAAALAPMWGVDLTTTGSKSVISIDGKDCVLMDSDGDAITIICHEGFITTLNIAAALADFADGDEYPYFTFDLLENDGSRMGISMAILAEVFDKTPEYDFGYLFNNLSALRIIFHKVSESAGNLAIKEITVGYDKREYLVEKKPVSGGSYTVTGCDPDKAYYYCLLPTESDEESIIETVDDFLAPLTLEAEVLSAVSYRAAWTTPYKAEECVVENCRVNVFDKDSEVYIYHDDFDKADKGSLELPDYVSSLDDYTVMPGWEVAGAAARIAPGMIGTAQSSRPWPPTGGYLYSPALDLSANNGKYTVSTRVYGTPGDVITVYREDSMAPDYSLVCHKLTVGDDGWAEESWEMTDGVAGKSIRFESKGMLQFLIDYLYISQTFPAGYTQYVTESEKTLNASETECVFENLAENATYAFRIKSLGKDLGGQPRESGYSDYRLVDLSSAGIESAKEVGEAVVTVAPGAVTVTVSESCTVAVYSVTGVRLAACKADGASALTFAIPSGNPVIVTAGGKAVKVFVP